MKSKKVIVHVVDSLGEGGAQTLIYEYAKGMSKDYEIFVMTIYPSSSLNYKRICQFAKIETVYSARNFFTRAFNKVFGFIYVPYKYKKIIKKIKPDVLHLHLLSLGFIWHIRRSLKGIKLFYTCHSAPYRMFDEERKTEGKAAKSLIHENGMRIIALHDEMRKEINERFFCDNTVVINNGIDIKHYSEIAVDKYALKESLGIRKESFIVGHVGRFQKVKNHFFLIDVFSEIKKQRDNAYLILIGTGALRNAVVEKTQELGIIDKVLFLSDRTDVLELLKIMDVFVFPSITEGLSIALLEAQAAGVKCIVSDSINKANVLSETTIPISLDSPASEWAKKALDTSIKNHNYGNLNDYDISQSISSLEMLYFGEGDS